MQKIQIFTNNYLVRREDIAILHYIQF